eukprot:CAMPEP_0196812852 /NCGR_PEP_ID=MMETSP1362-20130617/31690_1 /TAXON_ID=163516 /ORGANISM="Leptocylindrus danicus, Strain CCMP1856" /LENGTH=96 /DNA_ID=CAMNT_0042188777 /DNA_START=46 /DNA_END=336 /DNA_ORIENTATION=-
MSRSFSQSTAKLKIIFDTYRNENYSMETERAFQNEIMKVLDRNQDHQIHASDVRDFINNIGAMDKIGHDEIEFAVSEIGGGSDTASIDKMRSFLSS